MSRPAPPAISPHRLEVPPRQPDYRTLDRANLPP